MFYVTALVQTRARVNTNRTNCMIAKDTQIPSLQLTQLLYNKRKICQESCNYKTVLIKFCFCRRLRDSHLHTYFNCPIVWLASKSCPNGSAEVLLYSQSHRKKPTEVFGPIKNWRMIRYGYHLSAYNNRIIYNHNWILIIGIDKMQTHYAAEVASSTLLPVNVGQILDAHHFDVPN